MNWNKGLKCLVINAEFSRFDGSYSVFQKFVKISAVEIRQFWRGSMRFDEFRRDSTSIDEFHRASSRFDEFPIDSTRFDEFRRDFKYLLPTTKMPLSFKSVQVKNDDI